MAKFMAHVFVKGEDFKEVVESWRDKRGLTAITRQEYDTLEQLDRALRTFNAYVGRSLGDLEGRIEQPLKLPMVITDLPVYYAAAGHGSEIGEAKVYHWH